MNIARIFLFFLLASMVKLVAMENEQKENVVQRTDEAQGSQPAGRKRRAETEAGTVTADGEKEEFARTRKRAAGNSSASLPVGPHWPGSRASSSAALCNLDVAPPLDGVMTDGTSFPRPPMVSTPGLDFMTVLMEMRAGKSGGSGVERVPSTEAIAGPLAELRKIKEEEFGLFLRERAAHFAIKAWADEQEARGGAVHRCPDVQKTLSAMQVFEYYAFPLKQADGEGHALHCGYYALWFASRFILNPVAPNISSLDGEARLAFSGKLEGWEGTVTALRDEGTGAANLEANEIDLLRIAGFGDEPGWNEENENAILVAPSSNQLGEWLKMRAVTDNFVKWVRIFETGRPVALILNTGLDQAAANFATYHWICVGLQLVEDGVNMLVFDSGAGNDRRFDAICTELAKALVLLSAETLKNIARLEPVLHTLYTKYARCCSPQSSLHWNALCDFCWSMIAKLPDPEVFLAKFTTEIKRPIEQLLDTCRQNKVAISYATLHQLAPQPVEQLTSLVMDLRRIGGGEELTPAFLGINIVPSDAFTTCTQEYGFDAAGPARVMKEIAERLKQERASASDLEIDDLALALDAAGVEDPAFSAMVVREILGEEGTAAIVDPGVSGSSTNRPLLN